MINKIVQYIQECTDKKQLKLIAQSAQTRIMELEHQDEYGVGDKQKTTALGVDIAANPGRNYGTEP